MLEISGISYTIRKRFQSSAQCECQYCTPEIYMIHLSLNLAQIQNFLKWDIKTLMEYGLICKIIINRKYNLTDQIECFENRDLKKIIWLLFEDKKINSIILLIDSIGRK